MRVGGREKPNKTSHHQKFVVKKQEQIQARQQPMTPQKTIFLFLNLKLHQKSSFIFCAAPIAKFFCILKTTKKEKKGWKKRKYLIPALLMARPKTNRRSLQIVWLHRRIHTHIRSIISNL
jgi:hypothetical protein